ncbi:ImmA/IrrE family metallo-endopeptidase [Crocosphaera sp. XPORK-15E]|uniref:ImmA/IrrE family metallo-endopeptidase n=1 Tax=Crocosphaera sp. XPORK-15E TaxID=3110247 RepID=UPI002B1FFF98|nr:ImmA/IrrE family metallo-endopeptidase [Crocosphaera sp. XPORK-15E]MEA5533691.1 ImmA/IrrE family metallo-endopeptidase [Crocosphaera sp. XPORK-15E]
MSIIKPYTFYPKQIIEEKANQLLTQAKNDNYPLNWGAGITHHLLDVLDLNTLWEIIPNDNQGQIVAKIEPSKRLITLNENISELKNNKGFQQSTIAHEIGHWELHINQDEGDGLIQQLELSLNSLTEEKSFLCRVTGEENIHKIKLKIQDDRREWQAQYFAGCLLMPDYKLHECRKGRDLTIWKHLYAIADELCVTISNLIYRLQNLGWIYITKGSKQIYKGPKYIS